MNFLLQITPVGKPTMVSSDKWKKRPCVMNYRAFCDRLRYKAWGKNQKQKILQPTRLKVLCKFHTDDFLADGQPHTLKPDGSNILKAVEDGLFSNDEKIFDSSCEKYWTTDLDSIYVHWEAQP